MNHAEHNYKILDAWLKEMNESGHRVALVIGFDPTGKLKVSSIQMEQEKLCEILDTVAKNIRGKSGTIIA